MTMPRSARPADDRAADRGADRRVVHRLGGVRAEVHGVVAQALQRGDEVGLEVVARRGRIRSRSSSSALTRRRPVPGRPPRRTTRPGRSARPAPRRCGGRTGWTGRAGRGPRRPGRRRAGRRGSARRRRGPASRRRARSPRGPAASARRTNSLTVKVRPKQSRSITIASRRCIRAMQRTRSASASNPACTTRLRVARQVDLAAPHRLDRAVGRRGAVVHEAGRRDLRGRGTAARPGAGAGPRPSASGRCCPCTGTGRRWVERSGDRSRLSPTRTGNWAPGGAMRSRARQE